MNSELRIRLRSFTALRLFRMTNKPKAWRMSYVCFGDNRRLHPSNIVTIIIALLPRCNSELFLSYEASLWAYFYREAKNLCEAAHLISLPPFVRGKVARTK